MFRPASPTPIEDGLALVDGKCGPRAEISGADDRLGNVFGRCWVDWLRIQIADGLGSLLH